ncbi:hypothetical protein BGW80DRAFT_1565699 [Lactifluus volemus]|nr:hypothetical protein BGW80DRAFT_1565699 [Lactifluus volemus]
MLDVWPPFPIEICSYSPAGNIGDDIMAALEHHDRICKITLDVGRSYSEYLRLATLMQKPFPALTSLHLLSRRDEDPPVLPDMILGGSAPRLRSLILDGFPFPTFPRLLLSSNDLSELWLRNSPDIPSIGYISPEAMITGLSALTSLTHLSIQFERSGTVQGPPPVTRALLPALTDFRFHGDNEYLEDLLSRIDAPQLKHFSVQFFGPHINIRQVIRVSQSLTLGPYHRADVYLGLHDVNIRLYESDSAGEWVDGDGAPFSMEVMEEKDAPVQQVSSMAQISTQSLSILSSIIELNLQSDSFGSDWDGDDLEVLMDDPAWPVLLQPFTAVRTLRLTGKIRSFVISSLQGHTGESVTELLPELQNLYLYWHWQDELEEQAIDRFIAAPVQLAPSLAVTKLTCLEIGFKQPGEIRLAPPLTRALLRSLTFHDHSVKEYSENLLSQVDVPQLESLSMVYDVGIRLYQSVETDASKTLELGFMQYVRGYQAASMAQICTLSSLLPSVMELEIRSDGYFSTLDDKLEELEDVRDKF